MQVITYGMTKNEARHRHECQAELAEINVTEAALAEAGGFGQHIACINVDRPDGRQSRFHVSLYDTGHGRVRATVTAINAGSETTQRVTASFLNFEARRSGGDGR